MKVWWRSRTRNDQVSCFVHKPLQTPCEGNRPLCVWVNIVVRLGHFVQKLAFSWLDSCNRYLRSSRDRRAWCDRLCHEVVVVARRTCGDVGIGASCPGVGAPASDHSFLWLRRQKHFSESSMTTLGEKGWWVGVGGGSVNSPTAKQLSDSPRCVLLTLHSNWKQMVHVDASWLTLAWMEWGDLQELHRTNLTTLSQ